MLLMGIGESTVQYCKFEAIADRTRESIEVLETTASWLVLAMKSIKQNKEVWNYINVHTENSDDNDFHQEGMNLKHAEENLPKYSEIACICLLNGSTDARDESRRFINNPRAYITWRSGKWPQAMVIILCWLTSKKPS